MRLLATMALVSHGAACFWHWIAVEWRENTADWPTLSLARKYIRCWNIVIGCLNASPPAMFTAQEELTVACLMLVGNVIQASVFGSVAAVIASIDEEEAKYNNKIIEVVERCQFLDIPDKLSRRIRVWGYNVL